MSTSSTDAYPSATSRNASSSSAPCSRFMTKPSISRFITIGAWPAATISRRVRSTTAGSVHGAGTISTAGTRYGGLIGCTTRQRARPASVSVNFDGSRADVELDSTVPGSASASSSANTRCLLSRFSGVFSCTWSAPASAASSASLTVIRRATTSGVSSLRRPSAASAGRTLTANSAAAAAAPGVWS